MGQRRGPRGVGEQEIGSEEAEIQPQRRAAPKPVGQDLLIEMPIKQAKQRQRKTEKRVQLSLFENIFYKMPGDTIDLRYKLSNNLGRDLKNIRLLLRLEGPTHFERAKQVQFNGVQQILGNENYPLILPTDKEHRGTATFRIPLSAKHGEYKGGLRAKFN